MRVCTGLSCGCRGLRCGGRLRLASAHVATLRSATVYRVSFLDRLFRRPYTQTPSLILLPSAAGGVVKRFSVRPLLRLRRSPAARPTLKNKWPPPGGTLLGVGCKKKTDTWLILPVVICLSQRLSHACLSSSPKGKTANGSLKQL